MAKIDNAKPKFLYVTYIAATPEKVWQALTSAKMMERYWFGYQLNSDWKAGSTYTVKSPEGGHTFNTGMVLESDPPRRLSYTWHPKYDAAKGEPPSRVTFTLAAFKDQVQLTVVHDEFDAGSRVFEDISGGWPRVLSSLKSLLETGRPLERSWCAEDMKPQRAAAGAR